MIWHSLIRISTYFCSHLRAGLCQVSIDQDQRVILRPAQSSQVTSWEREREEIFEHELEKEEGSRRGDMGERTVNSQCGVCRQCWASPGTGGTAGVTCLGSPSLTPAQQSETTTAWAATLWGRTQAGHHWHPGHYQQTLQLLNHWYNTGKSRCQCWSFSVRMSNEQKRNQKLVGQSM